jgi:GDSL-like Lipase/Acylhydrolase family
MRFVVILAGVLAAGLLPASHPAGAADPRCAAPRELIEDEPALPKLAQDLKADRPVTIVVIGGASTAGIDADDAYPRFLEAALRARHPKAKVTVFNRGMAGQTTAQMVKRFARDVYAAHPALVIWETGTVDAVRSGDVNAFVEALTDGIAALREHKSEVMLIDMQYNPSTVSVINFGPYLDALHQTAALQDVYMFQRYDMMKYWDDTGAFNLVAASREKRFVVAREIYECLGERLADAVDFAAR